MKVKDLMKILELLDSDLPVAVPHGFRWTWLDKVEDAQIPETQYPTQRYIRLHGKETY